MEIYFLCGFAFLAGFIDSIVGGGGLVQVPAFFVLYPQLSVPNIIGTNRLASAVGTSVAAWNYAKMVEMPWKVIASAASAAAAMSYLGATLQSRLPAELLKPVILLLIVGIAIYTYRNKTFGQVEALRIPASRLSWFAALYGGLLGLYNGLVGPGTGSLLVFAFVSGIGFHFLKASAIAKVVNVAADVSSLLFFFMNKYILFHLAIPMLLCNVGGSYLGSRMAVLRGNAFIRKVFIVVVTGIILRFAWDIVKAF